MFRHMGSPAERPREALAHLVRCCSIDRPAKIGYGRSLAPVRVEFAVSHWAGWAPEITSEEAWRRWALASPVAPVGSQTPALSEVPPMSRRRIERMGRPAFQVAQWCAQEIRDIPMVFASRHGDPGRGAELLTALARQQPLSPTSFALSVHNAIGAQFSIVRGDTANVTAISNGLFTVEAGVLEAVTLLADGHSEVMLVTFDASLPTLFAPFADEPAADFAFAWRITSGHAFSLKTSEVEAHQPSVLPHALEVFRFFLGNDDSFTRAGWTWARHG